MRIKRGTTKQRRHKKIIGLASGYRGTNNHLFKRANEAVWHAGQYNLAHRRHRKSQMKSKWLEAINAALSMHGISYSKFVSGLHETGNILNSKMLCELAVNNPNDFAALVKQVQK